MDPRDLYQDIILDHGRHPRNFRALPHPSHFAHGHNPLCGDRVTVYVELDGERIKDVSFEGRGCAISTASASLMTEILKGKTLGEATALFKQFHTSVTGDDAPAPEGLEDEMERLAPSAPPSRPSSAISEDDLFDFELPETEDVERPEPDDGDPELTERVVAALKTVRDPEIPVNLIDLGLIYELIVRRDGTVYIEMTLTTPACPVAGALPDQVKEAVGAVEGVTDARVKLTWTPPWTRDRMSEEAKLELGLL